MQLPPFPFVVLDTETTGFVPRVHKVIEFASAVSREGEIVSEYETLCGIEGEIPPHVEVLTRIKTLDLRGKASFEACQADIAAAIGEDTLIVGQNIAYDIGMLKGEGLDLSERPRIDTSMLASLVFPECRSFSLGHLSDVLQLPHAPRHRALGDVRATVALLGKCWERLCSLPKSHLDQARTMLIKSTAGYQQLAMALPEGTDGPAPAWLQKIRPLPLPSERKSFVLTAPPVGTVELREESLDPGHLSDLLLAATQSGVKHWVAVKNIEAFLRSTPLPDDVSVLHPPFLLPNREGVDHLLKQDVFTADEATLALKMLWYKPHVRAEVPIHGDERSVWNAKIAATETSDTYVQQFSALGNVVILDHQQLLQFLADPAHAAKGMLTDGTHIIIDDASMLEDTATKAYGQFCNVDDIRAGAEGHAELTSFTDLLSIWIEKVGGGEDLRYLTTPDLQRAETKGLHELLTSLLADTSLAERTRRNLQSLSIILTDDRFDGRIAWIERRRDGGALLHSAPDAPDQLLKTHLYDRYATTLLLPCGHNDTLPPIIPPRLPTICSRLDVQPEPMQLRCDNTLELAAILQSPPEGKTILLLPSKRVIEQSYIRFAEALEARGITMICQGLSGGQGRMEAEFLSATGTTLWLLTPWTYEGVNLPLGTVSHLVIESLPFDHPGHPILSLRSKRYRYGFNEYFLPRLEHRLFRLLRTFCSQRTPEADIVILDKRLFSKDYGTRIRNYLARFAITTDDGELSAEPKPQPKKKAAPKKDDGQLSMF